jgi:hypothetical protein
VIDAGDDAEKYVEPQRDQTVADVARAVASGLTSAEHVKRATYIGTTIDQGRERVLTAEVVNRLLGWAPGTQVPRTRGRRIRRSRSRRWRDTTAARPCSTRSG